MSRPDSHRVDASREAEVKLHRILDEVRSLAAQASDNDLSGGYYKLKEAVDSVSLLCDLRHSAQGIVDLYTKVPILESVDIYSSYLMDDEPGRPTRSYICFFANATVLPDRLAPGVTLEQFENALDATFAHREPSSIAGIDLGDEPSHSLFYEDVCCLFSAADEDGEDLVNMAYRVSTSREQLMSVLNHSSNMDEVASVLFPKRWRQVAQALNLPMYRAQQAEQADSPRPRP